MQYRTIGRAGVKVSGLCLGGMTFGEPDTTSVMHGAGSPPEVAFAVLVVVRAGTVTSSPTRRNRFAAGRVGREVAVK